MREKLKKFWSYLKENIVDILKFVIFTVTGTVGFWMIYAVAWFSLGLPAEDWALWVLFALGIASEYGFIKWLEV